MPFWRVQVSSDGFPPFGFLFLHCTHTRLDLIAVRQYEEVSPVLEALDVMQQLLLSGATLPLMRKFNKSMHRQFALRDSQFSAPSRLLSPGSNESVKNPTVRLEVTVGE